MFRIRLLCLLAVLGAFSVAGRAAEVTVQNDSLSNFGEAVIVWGFVTGEKAASWLTSPCNGTLVAVQVFWRSPSGTTGQTIHSAIEIFRGGTFPNPGALAETIGGPVLNDGVLNEWRYLDENQVIPLAVPLDQDEDFVVSLTFASTPVANSDPSVVRDNNDIEPNRNAIFAEISPGTFQWFSAETFLVTGDWVIRAVIDCPEGPTEADVDVTMSAEPEMYTEGEPLDFTVTVGNAGPADSPNTTIVSTFAAAYEDIEWTCSATGGASCPAPGSGNIATNVSLPAAGEAVFDVTGTVAKDTTGSLSNTVIAVVGGDVSDPVPDNNTATVEVDPLAVKPEFADVAVTMSAQPEAYTAGMPLDFTITASNNGPDDSPVNTVVSVFAEAYEDIEWTCLATGSATCPASGVGDISTDIELPADAEAVFEVSGVVATDAIEALPNSVTIVVGGDVTDPEPENNSAALEVPPLKVGPLFSDRFEVVDP